VIVEEINMYEDLLQHKVGEELLSLMYGDQPSGWPIIGSKETVCSFSREDFVTYKNTHYHADNTVVVVVGPVDPDTVTNYVTANFAGIDTHTAAIKEPTAVISDGLRLRVITRPVPQAHVAFGFHSVPFRHPDGAAVSLLTTMLGRGMSSRLFQKLREELGAAYYVHAEQEAFIDHGIFGIAAGIDKDRVGVIFEAIANELQSFKRVLVDERELAKAKEYTLGMLRLGFETTDDIAAFYGMPLVLKKDIKTLEEIIDEYMKVTVEDIHRVANETFVSDALSIAIIGPYQEEDIPLGHFKNL
jgi:predicted Zn-dependent peptidase